MSLVTWRDEFRTGIGEVDEEHREMIALINTLHSNAILERSDERIETFLGEVYARISAHFALEEKIMHSAHYPELAAHKADHEQLLEDLREIMDDHLAHGVLDEEAFSARLSEWFGLHFRSHDVRLHRWHEASLRTPRPRR